MSYLSTLTLFGVNVTFISKPLDLNRLLVTVRNAGAGTLVGVATAAGAGFSLVGNASYSLNAGDTALLTVRFAPGPLRWRMEYTPGTGAERGHVLEAEGQLDVVAGATHEVELRLQRR